MSDPILDLIMKVAEEFNEFLEVKIPVERGPKAPLYGLNGVLDSLALASFIVAVEQALEDKMGKMLTLADEKAMSTKNSPFLSIGALASYIKDLIGESSNG